MLSLLPHIVFSSLLHSFFLSFSFLCLVFFSLSIFPPSLSLSLLYLFSPLSLHTLGSALNITLMKPVSGRRTLTLHCRTAWTSSCIWLRMAGSTLFAWILIGHPRSWRSWIQVRTGTSGQRSLQMSCISAHYKICFSGLVSIYGLSTDILSSSCSSNSPNQTMQ